MTEDWPVYGGCPGGNNYSPLGQINAENLDLLSVVWEWKTRELVSRDYAFRPGKFEATPIFIDNVLYLSTPYHRVVALDGDTGRERWAYDSKAYDYGPLVGMPGYIHRGVAAWRSPTTGELRIYLNSRHRLICLDGANGEPLEDFGKDGVVDLTRELKWHTRQDLYLSTSPPIVYEDLVIVGSSIPDYALFRQDPPGDVQAFNAITGERVWRFHTIPRANEFGSDTWLNDASSYTGHANVWAPMSVDGERGLLYLPVSTPSNDFYGGTRPGQNLFAESLVCLEAGTGQRVWHYQIVHHGLWDYDLASQPILATINLEEREVDAVVQLTKMGWAFVFDRATGIPVWPVDERPVPSSNVPGELAWPTQPVPSKPPPFSPQGTLLDDAFDLTEELRREATAELSRYRLGPLYTTPSLEGTVMRPGVLGGANWGGGAYDRETGILYVKSSNLPSLARLVEADGSQYGYEDALPFYVHHGQTRAVFHDGLPLTKPPYGHLSALNLGSGELLWRVPFGDNPSLRHHPALRGVALPDQLGAVGPAGVIVTGGGLIFAGCGDTSLHAVDKHSGETLWSHQLGRNVTGTPMTYTSRRGKQYVVVASGKGENATLTAFALTE